MSQIIVIDVGGTSIKYGLWNEEKKSLFAKNSLLTPKTLPKFYQALETIVAQFKNETIEGIGISIPGAVDQKTGIIGGISAVPYIHNFKIQQAIEQRLNLPITLENDANCAALAEVSTGAAKDLSNIMFMVLGTGVGGAVVVDRRLIHGFHLLGGEFGMILGDDDQRLSFTGTPVRLAQRYNQKTGQNMTGKQVFELANSGDRIAMAETNFMYRNLARAIYNLNFVIDPEVFVIGGGISANQQFVDQLQESIEDLVENIDDVKVVPKLIAAKYHNDANLIGAAYNYYNQ